jgi:chemotaxis protein histidine kinase CheA
MPDLKSDFDEKLNIIKHNYIKSLNEKFILLTNLKNSVNYSENTNDENSIKAFKEIYENVHKLSGSSAIFGFQKMSELSNKLELLLKEYIDGGYLSDKHNVYTGIECLLDEINNTVREDI